MPSRYDPLTALIVVDVQNDFADPEGSLYVSGGEEIIEGINKEAENAFVHGVLVVYTQDWHPEETPHFVDFGGIWPKHCVKDTWGAELHPGLRVPPDSWKVQKGVNGEDGYSGFSYRDPVTGEKGSTALPKLLYSRGVQRTVIVGIAGDVCVKETALDSLRMGLITSVNWHLVRSVNLKPGDGVRAIEELQRAGAFVF